MADSVESLGNVKEHCTYILCRGPYTICQGSGREEFGLSGKSRIQTEEGGAGCGCGDVVKAGYEHAPHSMAVAVKKARMQKGSIESTVRGVAKQIGAFAEEKN